MHKYANKYVNKYDNHIQKVGTYSNQNYFYIIHICISQLILELNQAVMSRPLKKSNFLTAKNSVAELIGVPVKPSSRYRVLRVFIRFDCIAEGGE